jgi:hypothetical protein
MMPNNPVPGAEDDITTAFRRLRRLMSIWRLSGSLKLALQAAQNRCQEVVEQFLLSGGLISNATVAYKDFQLPRRLFVGRDLAGVGYVRELANHGVLIETSNGLVFTKLPNGLRFAAREDRVVDTLCMLSERFVAEEYSWLEVRGRVVIDVGANIGDSVLYFAYRGAVHVFGYEPDGPAYVAAIRNLNLNNSANATVTNAAVVGRAQPAGEYVVSFAEVMAVAAREYPGVPIACKIDCEGCEYELLRPDVLAKVDMRNVTQLMVEYHWQSPKPLCEALESIGFEVESVRGAPGVGWIKARRSET